MHEIDHHQATNRWRHLPFKLLAALLMIGGSLVATSATAGAAPGNLADIDVKGIGNDVYVVGALTSGGTIQAEVVACYYENCQKHGWKSFGSGFKSVIVEYIGYGRPVLIGRRTNGATWFKRGNCSGVTCSWNSWYSMGGSVTTIAADTSYSCARRAGRSSTGSVFKAEICSDSFKRWSYTGGKLSQIATSSSSIFGTSPSGSLWWFDGNSWSGAGGRVTQPALHVGDSDELCGLAGQGRNLWCFDQYTYQWSNYGGYWRKLDDGKTVGVSKHWGAWAHNYRDAVSFGGQVNEVAWNDYLMVGVGADYKPWYQNTYNEGGNGWRAL